METTFSKPRRPWLAALLSLLGGGPLGQVYTGRLRRALCLWILFWFLMCVYGICTSALPIGRFGFALFTLCLFLFPLYLAVDAFLVARREHDTALKRYQRWWVYVLFFVAFVMANNAAAYSLAYFARSFIAEAFVIPSRSMSPTIQPGDRILVDKLWWSPEKIRRNDVVVFLSEGPGSPFFVARVAGLPGDEIEVRNERVFVNGKPWDDTHAVFQGELYSSQEPALANMGPITIPEGHFFELGDNRRMAKDSRLVGPIPMSSLHGVARMIYWSQDRAFPNPRDTTHYDLGPIRWDRMGQRLDEP